MYTDRMTAQWMPVGSECSATDDRYPTPKQLSFTETSPRSAQEN
jgi:hypothetical protein